jgi:hypothetical protein
MLRSFCWREFRRLHAGFGRHNRCGLLPAVRFQCGLAQVIFAHDVITIKDRSGSEGLITGQIARMPSDN